MDMLNFFARLSTHEAFTALTCRESTLCLACCLPSDELCEGLTPNLFSAHGSWISGRVALVMVQLPSQSAHWQLHVHAHMSAEFWFEESLSECSFGMGVPHLGCHRVSVLLCLN